MFFLASYDVDRLRRFTESGSFMKTYDLTEDEFKALTDAGYVLEFSRKSWLGHPSLLLHH